MNRLWWVLFLLCMGAPSVFAARPDFASTERLRKQYEETKKLILEGEEKQRRLMSSLFEINRKVKKIVIEKSKNDQQRMTLQASARELAQRLLELETKMKGQRVLLQTRLNAIYRLGGQGLARMIFSSANSSELERNLKILGLVAKRDLALMKDYSRTVRELGQKHKTLALRLGALKKVQKTISAQEANINQEAKEKTRILDSVRRSKTKALTQIQKMRERGLASQEEAENELLDLLLKPSFFEKKGLLSAPVPGPVVRKFGLWRDSEYNVLMNQKGLQFQTDSGITVKSIFSGQVSFAGELEGYGPTMIVDHGDHYYSVYGGLSALQLPLGSQVKEGQVIAAAGESLYFEIRHFSEPNDPHEWMKGSAP